MKQFRGIMIKLLPTKKIIISSIAVIALTAGSAMAIDVKVILVLPPPAPLVEEVPVGRPGYEAAGI